MVDGGEYETKWGVCNEGELHVDTAQFPDCDADTECAAAKKNCAESTVAGGVPVAGISHICAHRTLLIGL